MSQEIIEAVREIEREKGIETGTLVAALEDALLAAYKKTPGAARHATVELDDAGDVLHGERIEQDGVDDGEDGGVGAYAERHDEDDGYGEAGCVREAANGVPEIAQNAFEESEAVLLPEFFMDAARGAERDAGAALGFFR